MSNLQRWTGTNINPFRELSKIEDNFERMFDEMMTTRKKSLGDFSPSCEITEEGNNYILKFDIPGVKKDQVKVEIENDRLTVFAERKEEKTSETKKKYLSEVSYGSYTRSFTLPGAVNEKDVDAKFENGVLTVKVPKTETAKSNQIPVA